MENTVIGVYDSHAQAQKAMTELLSCGFSRSDMQLTSDGGKPVDDSTDHDQSGSGIVSFFRSLFGMDEHRETGDIYSEAVRRGSYVLTVSATDEAQLHQATEVMNRYDPVDIDERISHWRTEGWGGYEDTASMVDDSGIRKEGTGYVSEGMSHTRSNGGAVPSMNGETMNQGMPGESIAPVAAGQAGVESQRNDLTGTRIPVVEEQLHVGKRDMLRGGVRVYQRVRETPVRESVNLREEHVQVARHPVDRPASEADMKAFAEGSIEMHEMAEEPVVSKTARVVEEVLLDKTATQETANIDDTVRRTDVDVEQLGASSATRNPDLADTMTAAEDRDYRTHWQNAYGQSGGRYEDYDSAYRYGSSMAGTERYRNYRWEDAEPDMRREWESSHPESAWDKVKDAVRYGADKYRGHGTH